MAKDIAIIQVCFNLLDPFQRKLYERASNFPNRSGYCKRLIQWDIDREEVGYVSVGRKTSVVSQALDDFQVEGFI
ncbi:hypothetical protein [Paenibacillus sp. NRS-1760]|uniref:hypothetical protein n=1 Tax=Paenibacillus sp. NRS-1760 TaxID=3233902 RepID=UPI003D2A4E4D